MTTLVVWRQALPMVESTSSAAITIRPAVSQDADGIVRIYFESAEYHAGLDSERFWIPGTDAILARYREGRQHPPDIDGQAITLVAEVDGEIVGFLDVQLDHSPDPMHREITYCHVIELAVSNRHQNQGIGGRLLRAAEDWGRAQGADFASLEYLVANGRAGAFYERSGYRAASIAVVKRL
jgi:GNAT superfamily N-acetyltransferase